MEAQLPMKEWTKDFGEFGLCYIEQIQKGCLKLKREDIVEKTFPKGLKNFVCATPKGVALHFKLYQEKDTFLRW